MHTASHTLGPALSQSACKNCNTVLQALLSNETKLGSVHVLVVDLNRELMAVTLINVFKVPLDQEQNFLAGWKKTSAGLLARPGFIDACLHRNTGVANQEFLYINVAHWETAEDLRQSNPKSIWDANSLRGVQDFPGIFEEFIKLP